MSGNICYIKSAPRKGQKENNMKTTIELNYVEVKVIYRALRYYKMKKQNSELPSIQATVDVADELTSWDGKVYNAWADVHRDED